MFALNEKVVYPGHGVARINRIVEKKVAGVGTRFYELVFLSKDVMVLVPVSHAESVGLRRISSQKHIDTYVFATLGEPGEVLNTYESAASSWNKRNKNYQNKLHTGNLKELSEMYRDLLTIGMQKPLSFGEKNLLSQAEALLSEEISLVKGIDREAVTEKLRASCGSKSVENSY